MRFSAKVGERDFGNYDVPQFTVAVLRRRKFIKVNFLPRGQGHSGSLMVDHETAKRIAYALLLAASGEMESNPVTFSVDENAEES